MPHTRAHSARYPECANGVWTDLASELPKDRLWDILSFTRWGHGPREGLYSVGQTPDSSPVDEMGLDIETALGRQQRGQGDTLLCCSLADQAQGLGATGQLVIEKRPGVAIDFVAMVNLLVSGHLSVPFREPRLGAGKTPQCGVLVSPENSP